jgi:hypothetical protein
MVHGLGEYDNRMFVIASYDYIIIRAIWGERVVLHDLLTDPEDDNEAPDDTEDMTNSGGSTIYIVDFNVFQPASLFSRDSHGITQSGADIGPLEVLTPSSCPPEDLFKSEVTTSLPYRVMQVKLPVGSDDNAMVEQDCLAVINWVRIRISSNSCYISDLFDSPLTNLMDSWS